MQGLWKTGLTVDKYGKKRKRHHRKHFLKDKRHLIFKKEKISNKKYKEIFSEKKEQTSKVFFLTKNIKIDVYVCEVFKKTYIKSCKNPNKEWIKREVFIDTKTNLLKSRYYTISKSKKLIYFDPQKKCHVEYYSQNELPYYDGWGVTKIKNYEFSFFKTEQIKVKELNRKTFSFFQKKKAFFYKKPLPKYWENILTWKGTRAAKSCKKIANRQERAKMNEFLEKVKKDPEMFNAYFEKDYATKKSISWCVW